MTRIELAPSGPVPVFYFRPPPRARLAFARHPVRVEVVLARTLPSSPEGSLARPEPAAAAG